MNSTEIVSQIFNFDLFLGKQYVVLSCEAGQWQEGDFAQEYANIRVLVTGQVA